MTLRSDARTHRARPPLAVTSAREVSGLALLVLGVLGIWLSLAAPAHLVLVAARVAVQALTMAAAGAPRDDVRLACRWCRRRDRPWHRSEP